MSYRLPGPAAVTSALVLSIAATLLPAATAADPVLVFPREGCFTVEDAKDDAKLEFQKDPNIVIPSPARPHPGTEIENLSFNTTPTHLQAFLKVKNIPATTTAAPSETSPTDTMGAYDTFLMLRVQFKIGTKTFVYSRVLINDLAKGRLDPPPPDNGNVDGSDTPAEFAALDATKEYLVVLVKLDDINKKLGEGNELVPGETEIKVSGATRQYTMNRNRAFDTDVTAEAAYLAGDDTCFTPPKAKLSTLLGVAGTQYGDVANVSVKIVTADDEPLEAASLEFKIADKTLTATSNAAGIAKVTFPVDKTAGSYPVAISFAGDEDHGRASIAGTFVVKPEATKFWTAPAVARPNSTTRYVTVQVLDDDKKPLPSGQKVYWYVNGKKQGTPTTTDSAGRTTFRSARVGQTIQAEFAAVTGKYSGSKSAVVKV